MNVTNQSIETMDVFGGISPMANNREQEFICAEDDSDRAIPEGNYKAVCVACVKSSYKDREKIRYDFRAAESIYEGTILSMFCPVPQNGDGGRRFSRRTKFYLFYSLALGSLPVPNEPMSPSLPIGMTFVVQVKTVRPRIADDVSVP